MPLLRRCSAVLQSARHVSQACIPCESSPAADPERPCGAFARLPGASSGCEPRLGGLSLGETARPACRVRPGWRRCRKETCPNASHRFEHFFATRYALYSIFRTAPRTEKIAAYCKVRELRTVHVVASRQGYSPERASLLRKRGASAAEPWSPANAQPRAPLVHVAILVHELATGSVAAGQEPRVDLRWGWTCAAGPAVALT